MRLDKYIAKACGLTRSQAKKLIRSGSVQLNKQHVAAETLVNNNDEVLVDGVAIAKPGPRYFMLNKPAGIVCANQDKLYDTAIDIFWQEPHFEKLCCVGRLDLDTTGLLLVTDDGKWAHRVSSPNSQCKKTYHAELDCDVSENMIKHFAEGILLHGEKKLTQAAELQARGTGQALIRINEGKYHQIKRMFATCDATVLALHRSQIGNIILDDGLAPGEYRELTKAEIESV